MAAAAAWAAALPLVCQVDRFPDDVDVKLPVKAVVDEVDADAFSHLLMSLKLEQLLLERRGVTLFVPEDLGDAFLDASLRTSDPERRSFQRRDDEHVIWWAANLMSKKKIHFITIWKWFNKHLLNCFERKWNFFSFSL